MNSKIKILKNSGWCITKKFGSPADLYLEHKDKTGYMLIDDGRVTLDKACYHVFCSDNLEDKIFEGIIETDEELRIVLKVLGF